MGVVPLVQARHYGWEISCAHMAVSKGSHFDAIIAEEEGMPRWEDINFEVDLMVENPEAVVSKWVSAGASRVIVHVESMKDFEKIRAAVPED